MGQHADDVLLTENQGTVRFLTLNRPSVLNALNAEVFNRLETEIDAVSCDRDVRAVVIRSAGHRAFCSGADIDELEGLGVEAARQLLGRGQRVLAKIERSALPVIAAVRGHALGGGFELALACHLRVASTTARFGLPEAGIGLIPGYGGTQRLGAIVGRTVALAVMLADRRLDADAAFHHGLLAREPVPDGDLDDVVAALAAEVASKSPAAVRLILSAARHGMPTDEALGHETALASISVASADGIEGIAALRDNRRPRFGTS